LAKKENKNTLFWNQITSPVGDIFFVWRKEGVLTLSFIEGDYEKKISGFIKSDFTFIRSSSHIEKQLKEYFKGERKEFDCKLSTKGTPYQEKVWKELLKVPYGETVSYGELAKRVGNSKGARSVGMAVHFNPIGIIIPCHRVIMSSGKIGGYASGIDKKRWLLLHEKTFGSGN
jgi:methylated-DNA-[protein]-cysteine S-methyltransferase